MIAEFQIRTPAFISLVKEQLRQRIPVVPGVFPYLGRLSVVDHVEVPENDNGELWVERHAVPVPIRLRHPDDSGSLYTYVSSSALHVGLNIDLLIAAIDDLKTAGESPLDKLERLSLHLDFSIETDSTPGFPELCVVLDDVVAPPELRARIFSAVPISCGKLDLSGFPKELANLGLSTDEDLQTVAVRMQMMLPTGDILYDWRQFFDGKFPVHLPDGSDFSVWIDGELFLPPIERQTADDVLKDGSIHLTYYPVATLVQGERGAHVRIQFTGDYHEGCSISATVYIDVDFTIEDGKLVSYFHYDYDTDDWDVIGCAALASLTGSVGGFIVGRSLGGWLGGVIGALAGPAGGLLGVFLKVATADPAFPAPGSAGTTCVGSGDRDFVCTSPLSLPKLPGLSLAPTRTDCVDGGFLVSGPLVLSASRGAQLAVLATPFRWQIRDLCGAGDVVDRADLRLQNLGDQTLKFSSPVVVRNDPDGNFAPSGAIPDVTAGTEVHYSLSSRETSAYRARPDPYPCEVLILSNGGARLLTLAAPSITSELRFRLDKELTVLRATLCSEPAAALAKDGQVKVKWQGWRPPQLDGTWMQAWQLVLGPIHGSKQVELIDASGAAVATGFPGFGGEVELGLVEEMTADAAIELRLSDAPLQRRLQVAVDRAALQVRYAVFRRVASIGLAAPCLSLSGAPMTVQAVTKEGHLDFDIRDPALPKLVRRTDHLQKVDGVIGSLAARVHEGGVTLHGTETGSPVRGRIEIAGAQRVARVRGGRGFPAIFVGCEGEGGVVFDVRDANAPIEIARYRSDPFFAGAVVHGRTVARLDPSRRRIDLYRRVWDGTESYFDQS